MKYVLIFLVCLIASPALATTPPAFPPPKRYDYPYKGTRYIVYLNPAQILAECGLAYACTYVGGESRGRCTTRILQEGSRPLLGGYRIDRAGWWQLWRHETGHCNGWPANHPR